MPASVIQSAIAGSLQAGMGGAPSGIFIFCGRRNAT